MLFGFLTLFFISGSANISNDYFDRNVDKINLPSRSLPSGRITVRELWALFSLFIILGFITASLLGPNVLILVFLLWGIAFLYNMKRKECGLNPHNQRTELDSIPIFTTIPIIRYLHPVV